MNLTTRLSLRYPAGVDAPDVPQYMQYLAEDVERCLLIGTTAQRPAAAYAGRRFVSTDDRTEYVDTGTSWVTVSKSVSRVAHGWSLMLPLTVASIPGYFHSQETNEARKLVKLRGRLFGTSPTATVQVRRNGTSFKTLTMSGTATNYVLAAGEIQTLAEDDYIDLNVTAQSATTGMVLTLFEGGA